MAMMLIKRISSAAHSRIPVTHASFHPPLFRFASRGIAYKLFVGGLSFSTTEKGLSDTFSEFGQVVEVKIVTEIVSDKSKGFGFVTFASQDEAEKAITQMNGKVLHGRGIFVDYAKPKPKLVWECPQPFARGATVPEHRE